MQGPQASLHNYQQNLAQRYLSLKMKKSRRKKYHGYFNASR